MGWTDEVAAALAGIAPAGVRVGCRRVTAADVASLHPAEAATVERAVAKRRDEFATGRALLRDLLGRDVTIVPRADRRPDLPQGTVGSLAHTERLAIGAIASDQAFRALGIDVEPATPLEAPVASAILRPDENGLDAHLAFTLKEAVYKAWSSLGGAIIDHHDVRVRLAGDTFVGSVIEAAASFHGRWARAGGHWLALVEVPAQLPAGNVSQGSVRRATLHVTQPATRANERGDDRNDLDARVIVVGTPSAPGEVVLQLVPDRSGVRVDDRLAVDLDRLESIATARPEVRFVHVARHPFAALAGAGDHRAAEEAWVTANGNLFDLAERIGTDRCFVARWEDIHAGRTGPLRSFLGVEGAAAPAPPVLVGADPEVTEHRAGRAVRAMAAELGYELDAPVPPASTGTAGADTIVPIARGARVPASPAQQRLLFMESLVPGLAVHNLPSVKRVIGVLDPDALAAALAAVVRRHEALRTDYEQVDGEWYQVVAPPTAVEVPSDDLRGIAAAELDGVVAAAIAEEVRRPFLLTSGLKVRARLLRTADTEHLLVVTLHHIAADGSSIVRLTSEVAAWYAATALGSEPSVPVLPVQYADFTLWQRQQLADGALAAQLDHWRDRLAGRLPVLELPTDRPRPAAFEHAAGSVEVAFDADATAGLRAAARAAGVTPFMFLLATYAATLARWSASDDVIVGTATANRRAETEHLVGLFASTVPIRVGIGADATFADLLGDVKREVLSALGNQDVPFDRIVQVVNPPRDLSRAPIFQTMFVLNNMTPAQLRPFGGILVEDVPATTAAVELDLSVVLDDAPDRLTGRIDYATALFDETTIERFVRSWHELLAAAVADADRRVADLPVVPADEAATLLGEWNATDAPPPPWERVEQWCAAQAAATPDAVAVVDGDIVLTYRELDETSNRAARHLIAHGVRPGDRVGVAVERSAVVIEVLLAVLKAGAAYVPLDPAFPDERLRFMVADAGLTLVATAGEHVTESFAGIVGEDSGVTLVDVAADEDEITARDGSPVPLEASGDGAAYVIYTSGSTGVPKGVVVGHRGVVNFLASMQSTPGMVPSDVLVAVTTLSFDISVLECFLPLVTGAQVVVASPDDVLDGRLLAELVERAGATVLQATPTTFAMMFELGWAGRPGLKVLCGGEAMSPELGARLRATCGPVWNMFGPTETTIWSTIAPVDDDALAAAAGTSSVTIGRPIANTVCRVLDPGGGLTPVGVPGELYIGGAGVALGYLDRAELTAARFVPDPFAPGDRLYRTGDLARWRSDGSLEFLGRIDQQVKVRGHRIELGEIESALRSDPTVADAVVVADGAGTLARLVAYVTAAGDQVPVAADLRARVRDELPQYMVPSVVMTLAAFPLTPNRKIDRRALPAAASAAATTSVPPANDVERVVARAVAEVLRVGGIGRDDDFFEMGGHSLLATSLLARLSATFGRTLPLRPFFAEPTVAGLGAELLRDSDERSRVERIASIEERIAGMSDDEVAAMLAAKRAASDAP